MINGKNFEHRPISELFAIVKNDFKTFDEEGLIDEGTLIKTIMYCNERLGIQIRELREVAIEVNDFRAEKPLDFEKLYYVCALKATNTFVSSGRNPFDNNFDQDKIYEAHLDRGSLGCVENYRVVIERKGETTYHTHGTWIELGLNPSSQKFCHIDCPNKRKPGRYTIDITDNGIETPFRSGTLYMMYLGMMRNSEGEILFPFHPMITPYYEWSLKEKILEDALFNSDTTNIGELYKLAGTKKAGAWIDAFNITTERSYGEIVKAQRDKELKWYNQYFKYFQ